MQNEKKLVVLFPGFGYGPDKPLLYYAAKVARRKRLDCMAVQYSQQHGQAVAVQTHTQTAR